MFHFPTIVSLQNKPSIHFLQANHEQALQDTAKKAHKHRGEIEEQMADMKVSINILLFWVDFQLGLKNTRSVFISSW